LGFEYFFSRSSTGIHDWLLFDGVKYNNTPDSPVAVTGSFGANIIKNHQTIVDLQGANNYCASNYFPSSSAGVPCFVISFSTSSSECVSVVPDFKIIPCCQNTVQLPTSQTLQGSVSAQFLSSECVNLTSLGSLGIFQCNIKITDKNGTSINPLSRFVKIITDTGSFLTCNMAP